MSHILISIQCDHCVTHSANLDHNEVLIYAPNYPVSSDSERKLRGQMGENSSLVSLGPHLSLRLNPSL